MLSTQDTAVPLLKRASFSYEEENELRSSNEFLRYNHILNKDGSLNLIKKGINHLKRELFRKDAFHSLINSPWWKLILFILGCYVIVWILFAFGYFTCLSIDPEGCITNAHLTELAPSHFERFSISFFFSVQTQQTIGFGYMSPGSFFASMIVTFQAMVGVIMDACAAGLIYAKFSRATTRASSLLFSKYAIIGNRDGKRSFFFRIIDIRKHFLVEPHIRLYLARNASTAEGEKYINFEPLPVTLGDSYIVFLSGYPLTVTHVIDEKSPLNDLENLKQGEIVVMLEGTEATTASTIQARYSYNYNDIVFNGMFTNMVSLKNGKLEVDFTKFNAIQKQ